MTDWPAFAEREAALAAIEDRLRGAPDALDLRVERAQLLSALGRNDDAMQAYLHVLGRDETHFGALTGLGQLAHAMGHRSAASGASIMRRG